MPDGSAVPGTVPRMRSLTALLTATALLVLTGCGTDPAADRPGTPDREPSATPSPDPTKEPVVATGTKVTQKPVSYRIPKTWTGPRYNYGRLVATSHSADTMHTVSSVWIGDIFVESTTIDVYAPEAFDRAREDDPRAKRLPNLTVDGVEVYAIESVDRKLNIRTVEYGTAEGPYITRLIITTWTDYITPKDERVLHESVLNSVRWKF